MSDTTLDDVKQAVAGTMKKARNRGGEIGRDLAETMDDGRDAAADALHRASESIHSTAKDLPGGRAVAGLAHSAANRLDDAAGYIAEHDAKEMLADVGYVVKRHPGKSLMIAATLGFFAGRALRRRRS